MNCELCGKETNQPIQIILEGSTMNVCLNCKSLGKTKPKIQIYQQKKYAYNEPQEFVKKNFANIIKSKRQTLKLLPKKLAEELKEKESTILNIESGKLTPSIQLAKKLERKLEITLIETINQDIELEKKESQPLTIGDMIKIKTRTRK